MSFCKVSKVPITVSKNGHLEPADVAQGRSSGAALPGLLRTCVALVSSIEKPRQNLALQNYTFYSKEWSSSSQRVHDLHGKRNCTAEEFIGIVRDEMKART